MLNPKKRSDNRRDALISKKNPNQADISELFLSRATDKFTVKRGIGNFVALATETFVNNLVNNLLSLIGALPTVTTVNVSAIQIGTAAYMPLLPNLELIDSDGYYDMDKIIIELTHAGDTGYDLSGATRLVIEDLDGTVLAALEDLYYFTDTDSSHYVAILKPTMPFSYLNKGVVMSFQDDIGNLVALTLGEATMKVALIHTVRTFGA